VEVTGVPMHLSRGVRPKNRRALIVAAAADLFCDRGYAGVSTADLAAAVGVGRSALYRHFPGKQELLAGVVRERVDPLVQHLRSTDRSNFVDVATTLGEFALTHRRDGILWHREARYLTRQNRRQFQRQVDEIVRLIRESVTVVRGDVTAGAEELLAWALLGVFLSLSFHRIGMPTEKFLAELQAMAVRVVRAPAFDMSRTAKPPPNILAPQSRREALIAGATGLFAERGYEGVSTEDLGRVIDVAGPSVYNYVTSKHDLLETAIRRGGAYLMMDLAYVLSTSATPSEGLRKLLDAYIRFATNHPDLLTLLICDLQHLPAAARQEAVETQREYVAEWKRLLLLMHPHLPNDVASIRVHASITIINTTARVDHLRRSYDYQSAVRAIAESLLVDNV
jgi:AcrR family transcriptional regulator